MSQMRLRLLLVSGFALVLFGCTSTGNPFLRDESSATVVEKITKGVSTKEQVRGMYGDPDDTSFTGVGSEIWKYQYTHTRATGLSYVPIVQIFAGGEDIEKKELVILFDKSGVVENYSMQQSKRETRGGIFQRSR